MITILTVIAIGTLSYKGATAKEALASEVVGAVPAWVKKNNLPPAAVPGAKLFAQSGCLTCHTYLGTGSSNLGAPDLSAEGTRKSVEQLQAYIADPSKFGNNVMPKFGSLGPTLLHQLAVFLSASKGPK